MRGWVWVIAGFVGEGEGLEELAVWDAESVVAEVGAGVRSEGGSLR